MSSPFWGAQTLQLTNEDNIDTTRCKGTALSRPSQPIFKNPGVKTVLVFLGETKVRLCDALQDVVVVFGRAEDARRRVRHIPASREVRTRRLVAHTTEHVENGPGNVNVKQSQKTYERMTHLQSGT
jgi:hypothetical protein